MLNHDFANWLYGYFKINKSNELHNDDLAIDTETIIKHYQMMLVNYPKGVLVGSIAWQFKIFLDLVQSYRETDLFLFTVSDWKYIEEIVNFYTSQKGWALNERAVAYMLQGYLEISDCNQLNQNQYLAIEELLNTQPCNFLKKTRAVIVLSEESECIKEKMFDIIQDEIYDYFIHMIEPTFGDESIQTALKTIHNTSSYLEEGSDEDDFESKVEAYC